MGHGRHNVTRRRTKTDSLRNLSDSGDRNIFGCTVYFAKKAIKEEEGENEETGRERKRLLQCISLIHSCPCILIMSPVKKSNVLFPKGVLLIFALLNKSI